MVGAKTASKRKAEGIGELGGQAIGQRKRFKGRKIGVKDKERKQSSRGSSGLQNGNGVRNGGRKRTGLRSERGGSWERKAVGGT